MWQLYLGHKLQIMEWGYSLQVYCIAADVVTLSDMLCYRRINTLFSIGFICLSGLISAVCLPRIR